MNMRREDDDDGDVDIDDVNNNRRTNEHNTDKEREQYNSFSSLRNYAQSRIQHKLFDLNLVLVYCANAMQC